ncbi:MAG: sigma-70 family RNA polymerase sigma factor [Sphingobium sp.]
MKTEARRLEIWRAHRARLIDSVTPMVGDRGTAEDVVQEAWLRFNHSANAPANMPDRPAQRQPVGYLYRIVRNLAIDLTRRRGIEQGVTPLDPPPLEDIADMRPSPEREAIDRDALDMVAQRLASLPERSRIAFEMYNLGGYTLQQIAHHLHISVGMAHNLVKQAVACCMKAVADDED